MNKLNHHIYISIHKKYENTIIPTLPRIITSYLLKNPTKLSLYLNPNITLDMLLKYLKPNQALLTQIITIVEESYAPK